MKELLMNNRQQQASSDDEGFLDNRTTSFFFFYYNDDDDRSAAPIVGRLSQSVAVLSLLKKSILVLICFLVAEGVGARGREVDG